MNSNKFSQLKSSLFEFPTSENKSEALVQFIYLLSRGHELFVIENCKEECRIREAPPFCNSWEIFLENTFSRENLRDVENASKVEVHETDASIYFKIKRSMLVYEEVPMLSLDNFVGQLGGLIGLYIGWSFLNVGMFALVRLTKFVKRPTVAASDVALSQKQIGDMINALNKKIETMQRRIEETKS